MQDSIGFQEPSNKEGWIESGCKSLDSFNHTSMIPENPLHRKGSRASATSGTSYHFIADKRGLLIRFSEILKYFSSSSIPIKFLPVFIHATPVVPLPIVLSKTV